MLLAVASVAMSMELEAVADVTIELSAEDTMLSTGIPLTVGATNTRLNKRLLQNILDKSDETRIRYSSLRD